MGLGGRFLFALVHEHWKSIEETQQFPPGGEEDTVELSVHSQAAPTPVHGVDVMQGGLEAVHVFEL